HTVPAGVFASAGQAALVPVQVSATSQPPAAARHSTLAGWKASAGQAGFVPLQVSATSQAPAAARHTVPAWPAGCWHASLLPSHWSRVRGAPWSLQAVPLACFGSGGHAGREAVQGAGKAQPQAGARQRLLAG